MKTATKHRRLFVAASVASALVFLFFLEAAAFRLTGAFEYPLDDAYIHLAMAEGLWSGTYGVNPAEMASAASSVLYPVLLPPIISPEFQRFLPLFWNIVGLVLSAWLWAELLLAGGYGRAGLRWIGLFLAVVGPITLQMPAVAFLGMEHALHAAASLAILLAVVRHLQGQTPWALLFAGILFAPLLRYEGVGLALAAAGVLFVTGRRLPALAAVVIALLPLGLFSAYLVLHGLDPLPNSVMAKQIAATDSSLNPAAQRLVAFRVNIGTAGGALVLAFVLGSWLLMAVGTRLRQSPLRWLVGFVVLAGLGHLLFGQVGWLNRYEHYVLVVLAAGFLVLLANSGIEKKFPAILTMLAIASLVAPGMVYMREVVLGFRFNPRAIHLQQGQMARFAQEYWRAPVAVNDIGRLSWNNPNYVLDLWGLASAEALRLRLANQAGDGEPKGWADGLAERHGVDLAMIYEHWLQDAIGKDWVVLGDFRLNDRRGFLGGDRVRFYATNPDAADSIRLVLGEWVKTLDERTKFQFSEVIQ